MKTYPRKTLAFSVVVLAMSLMLAAVVVGGYYYVEPSLPQAEELRDVRLQVPLRIYSRDGRLMAQIGEEKRTPIAYEAIPELIIQAVLATEDDTFFEHPGLDFTGTARAAVNFLSTNDGRVPGGSTITQQIAKRFFLSSEYSLVRKFKEAILALRIESEFTKIEILELYLNTVPYGQRSFGIVAAAQTYFNKTLSELTISEVAVIAGIPQAPSVQNPYTSPENATARRAYVLRRMRELNVIDESQYRAALAEPVIGHRYGAQTELEAPYVAEMVRAELIRRFGDAAYTAGLKVTTTLDSRLQAAANDAVRQTLVGYDERHGYRGPVRQMEWAEDALPEAMDDARAREILADYPDPVDMETALVLEVDELSAQIYLRSRGRQTIDLGAVEWAARHVSDDDTPE